MKKLVHYILIAIMFNWNVSVFAEDSEGCKWETVEETKTYIQEKCGDNQARIRSKPVEGLNIITVEAPEKSKENPIKKFKDTVEETSKATAKVEKLEKIEQEVIVTEKKVKELKEEKDVAKKVEEHIENKKLAETPVEETQKPIIKEEIAKVEEEKKADEKLVKEATEKEWADVDAEQKVSWMQFHELLPRLIVENEKIKAAELDYEAAVEALKSEYTAYYPQVTVSIGNNWEDDRTPAKGTYPNNTITHDSKQGIQKSITVTQMIWDAGRTTAMIDKAKATAQQAHYRLELTKEDVVMEAINAWLNLQKAYNTHEANKKVEANAKITLAMTIEKVKKGEGSKLEQLQIEQQYRTFQTLSMTSRLGLDSAIQRFQNVWRWKPHNIAEMPKPLADVLGIIPVQGTPVSNNTSLRIASMDITIAQEQLAFDNAEFKPRVDGKLSYTEKDGELSGGYDTDDAQKEEWRADITMTWKLFNLKNKHMTNADRSRLSAAQFRHRDILRTTQEQFDNAWNNYVLVEKNLQTLKRTVEINDEMYKLTLADFQAGNSPIMAVFGMKTAHLMSEVAYLNAQIDWQMARYQLHKVLGLVDPIIK
jgi:outer membrane protein TolC|tara:strand:- start:69 stop:1847 length:1779 start_codon:yes stop_codon:yes gene_type:complete